MFIYTSCTITRRPNEEEAAQLFDSFFSLLAESLKNSKNKGKTQMTLVPIIIKTHIEDKKRVWLYETIDMMRIVK